MNTFLPMIGNGPTIAAQSDKARQLYDIARAHPLQQRPQMAWSDLLASVATAYAERMARERFFSHVDPQGRGADHRVREAGYSLPYGGERDINHVESITAYYEDAQGAFDRWLTTGHRVHVLATDPFYAEQTEVGVGFYELEGSEWIRYWVFIACPPEPSQ